MLTIGGVACVGAARGRRVPPPPEGEEEEEEEERPRPPGEAEEGAVVGDLINRKCI